MRASLFALAASLSLAPTFAQADIASVWVSGKGSYVNGTGETFTRFQGSPTAGAEVGVHFLFLDLWADVVAMEQDQLLITANLGPNLSFGSDLKFNIGAFGSAMFFLFPEEASSGGLTFTPQQRDVINQAGYGDQIADIQRSYDEYTAAEDDLGRTAYGVAARARASLEYFLIPVLAVGVEGLAGYHWIVGGKDVANGLKNEAIDQLAKEQQLPPEMTAIVRDAAGAEAVDTGSLNGLHYQAGLYVKLKFGL